MRILSELIHEVEIIGDRDAMNLQGSNENSLLRRNLLNFRRSLESLRLPVSSRLEAGMSEMCLPTLMFDCPSQTRHYHTVLDAMNLMILELGYGSCGRSMYCLVRRSTRWGKEGSLEGFLTWPTSEPLA